MTTAERSALRRKYSPDKLRAIRKLYDRDVSDWAPIDEEGDLDIKCISTERGPWPDAEWDARTRGTPKRACLHEDILTQYVNQVVNKIEQNPMGVEAQPSGDGATPESAERLENRIRQIEYEENAQFAYQTAVKSAVERSVGWWKMESRYAGKFNQCVSIVPITDPSTVTPGFWKKPDASDMRRAWEHEWMSIEEFRERWPKAVIRSFEGFREAGTAWGNESSVQVCAWWHLESDEQELLLIQDGDAYREVYGRDVSEFPALDESKVARRRIVKTNRVLKTIMTGVEVLDETEWIDPGTLDAEGAQTEPPEIPIFGVFGRVKYEDGKMVIESLVRKGRVGQLLYDFTISAIQETIAMTPRVTRTGPEGTFDTSTNWDPRALTATKEWKPVTDPETNMLLPPPVVETYEPPIQALELAKQSILIGVQNAIGMSSTERKDRVAKSGKALDAIKEEMTVGTSHYFSATRIAQERGYRTLSRIIPVLEQAGREVGFRDKFGKHKIETLGEGCYSGKHSIAVGTGKLYQTLQEKQEELSQELLQSKDPVITMAVMPSAIRLRGVGPEGDKLADMLEAMQPAPMQKARDQGKDGKPKLPPEVQQGIDKMAEDLKAQSAYGEEANKKIIELQDQIAAQTVQNESKQKISAEDNATKLKLEQMKIDAELALEDMKLRAEFALKELEFKIAQMQQRTVMAKTHEELSSKEALAEHSTEHAETEAERTRQHTSEEADKGRKHETETAKETK